MKRNTHTIVPAARFRLLQGQDSLSCYQVGGWLLPRGGWLVVAAPRPPPSAPPEPPLHSPLPKPPSSTGGVPGGEFGSHPPTPPLPSPLHPTPNPTTPPRSSTPEQRSTCSAQPAASAPSTAPAATPTAMRVGGRVVHLLVAVCVCGGVCLWGVCVRACVCAPAVTIDCTASLTVASTHNQLHCRPTSSVPSPPSLPARPCLQSPFTASPPPRSPPPEYGRSRAASGRRRWRPAAYGSSARRGGEPAPPAALTHTFSVPAWRHRQCLTRLPLVVAAPPACHPPAHISQTHLHALGSVLAELVKWHLDAVVHRSGRRTGTPVLAAASALPAPSPSPSPFSRMLSLTLLRLLAVPTMVQSGGRGMGGRAGRSRQPQQRRMHASQCCL